MVEGVRSVDFATAKLVRGLNFHLEAGEKTQAAVTKDAIVGYACVAPALKHH